MTTMARADFEAEVAHMPGDDTQLIFLDNEAETIEVGEFQKLLAEAPPSPLPYMDNGVWDCDKFTRWLIAVLNVLHARTQPKSPKAWGVLNGNVPCDGDHCKRDYHSLMFFYDQKKRLYLAGAQDRQVMNLYEVGRILDVQSLLVGG